MYTFTSNLKKPYVLALFVAIFLVLLSGYLLNRQISKLNESAELVSHTVEVKEEIHKLYTSLVLIESSELTYSITKDSIHIETFNQLKKRSEISLKELIKNTSDNSSQQLRLSSISLLKDSVFTHLKTINSRLEEERIGSIWVQKQMLEISNLMDKIRSIKNIMLSAEDTLLKNRVEKYISETRMTPLTSSLMVILSITIFLLSFKKIMDNKRKLAETQSLLTNVLSSTENIISHFEAIRDDNDEIVDFVIIYTNELIKEVYGESAQKIIGEPISKVYPTLFENGVFELLVNCVNNDIPQYYERDFNFTGEEFWFYSSVRKLNDGVTISSTNVTYRKIAERKLAKKNKFLKRSNAELESFNRVASHDLQEPLRKIQLFISRLYDSEKDTFTENGKIYLDKVNNSAMRMQSLIKYLLMYSRVNREGQKFMLTDLNEVLVKVQEDLAEQIIENNVKIEIEKLPLVRGIAFQLEQLFNNLINNSIKYRKKDSIPVITITSKRVNKKFIEIYVTDNGIGFNQEYANKVFELFQRLHQKNEYSGTGIGLAICKKIAEAHNGYISAISNQNEGTTVIIKLPHSLTK